MTKNFFYIKIFMFIAIIKLIYTVVIYFYYIVKDILNSKIRIINMINNLFNRFVVILSLFFLQPIKISTNEDG